MSDSAAHELTDPARPVPSGLAGAAVFITGASRGLGAAMAIGFAGAGARVALAARTRTDLEQVAARCRDAGAGDVAVLATDVTAEDQVEAAVGAAAQRFGGLDAVVANAGVAASSLGAAGMTTLESYSTRVAEQILRVNTLGVWQVMKAAFPRMAAGGSFIAVSSELGSAPRPGTGLLAVSKAGVNALVAIAAAEQARRGIRVNLLSPGGMVDTHLFGPNKLPAAVKARMPVAEPEVIVPAALWLASPASAGVSGRMLSAPHFNDSTPEAIRAELAS